MGKVSLLAPAIRIMFLASITALRNTDVPSFFLITLNIYPSISPRKTFRHKEKIQKSLRRISLYVLNKCYSLTAGRRSILHLSLPHKRLWQVPPHLQLLKGNLHYCLPNYPAASQIKAKHICLFVPNKPVNLPSCDTIGLTAVSYAFNTIHVREECGICSCQTRVLEAQRLSV